MIDVLDQIKPLLKFESSDDFYYLQILQRKKENPDIGSNSRVIKNYYIGSIERLEQQWEEIKQLCEVFNARASLRLNKRSYRKVAFKAMQNIANSMANEEYSFIKKSYDRACGNGHNDGDKTWIIDLDGVMSNGYMISLMECMDAAQPQGSKLVVRLPTKNGTHLVVRPFDLREFKMKYPNIDIHKDNPINLYIP